MGKVEEYRNALRELDSWDSFLLRESNLPGPRANLELAFAVASEGDEALILRYASLDEETAPAQSREEFLAFCGTLGLGYLAAGGRLEMLPLIRARATDSRWRIREAVALGMQRYGRQDMNGLLELMESWATGSCFERRAAVASLCVPSLLKDMEQATKVFDLLDRITASVPLEKDKRSDGFQALRKALGYGWSVAVVAQPDIGRERMEKWVPNESNDIRWIIKQNLKKKRLIRMDAQWVEAQLRGIEG